MGQSSIFIDNCGLTCDVLCDLVPFVQFKNREEYPWKSVAFSKALACNFTESKTTPWVFFTFFKLHKWYQIAQRISYMLAGSFILIYSAKISRSWKTDPKITRPVIINELIDTNLPQYAVGPGGEKNTQVGCCWNAGPLHFDGTGVFLQYRHHVFHKYGNPIMHLL